MKPKPVGQGRKCLQSPPPSCESVRVILRCPRVICHLTGCLLVVDSAWRQNPIEMAAEMVFTAGTS